MSSRCTHATQSFFHFGPNGFKVHYDYAESDYTDSILPPNVSPVIAKNGIEGTRIETACGPRKSGTTDPC